MWTSDYTLIGEYQSGTLFPIISSMLLKLMCCSCGHFAASSFLGMWTLDTGIISLLYTMGSSITLFISKSQTSRSLCVSTQFLFAHGVHCDINCLPIVPRLCIKLSEQNVTLLPGSKNAYVSIAFSSFIDLTFTWIIAIVH